MLVHVTLSHQACIVYLSREINLTPQSSHVLVSAALETASSLDGTGTVTELVLRLLTLARHEYTNFNSFSRLRAFESPKLI
jgi:hypothetical protein